MRLSAHPDGRGGFTVHVVRTPAHEGPGWHTLCGQLAGWGGGLAGIFGGKAAVVDCGACRRIAKLPPLCKGCGREGPQALRHCARCLEAAWISIDEGQEEP